MSLNELADRHNKLKWQALNLDLTFFFISQLLSLMIFDRYPSERTLSLSFCLAYRRPVFLRKRFGPFNSFLWLTSCCKPFSFSILDFPCQPSDLQSLEVAGIQFRTIRRVVY